MSRAIRKACTAVILTADLYREMVASAIRLFRPDSYHGRSASYRACLDRHGAV